MKTLVINSAKGGVGKTTITQNIAIKLRDSGKKVMILDLDVTTPNVSKLHNIEVVSPPLRVQMTKAQLKSYIKTTLRTNNMNAIDWLLIDTPPTISDAYTAIYESIKNAKILFVSTGDENSIVDTGVGIRFFGLRHFKTIGVVQNMLCDEIGLEFDSNKKLGVKTIGKIPFTNKKKISTYFDWALTLNDIPFNTTQLVEEEKSEIFRSMTIQELEYGRNVPLRFYNLETWDFVREKMEDEASFVGMPMDANFDISTEKISEIIDAGKQCSILVLKYVAVEDGPLPYEVLQADIVYHNPVSLGLPMFLLANGVYLWAHEAKIVHADEINDILYGGGIDLGGGRIVPSLHNMLYFNRAFGDRGSVVDMEKTLISRYIKEVQPNSVNYKYLTSMLADLEGYDSYDKMIKDSHLYDKKFLDYLEWLQNIEFDEV